MERLFAPSPLLATDTTPATGVTAPAHHGESRQDPRLDARTANEIGGCFHSRAVYPAGSNYFTRCNIVIYYLDG